MDVCCGRGCSGAGSTRGAALTMYWSRLDMNLPEADRYSVINLTGVLRKSNPGLGDKGLRFDLKSIPESL